MLGGTSRDAWVILGLGWGHLDGLVELGLVNKL